MLGPHSESGFQQSYPDHPHALFPLPGADERGRPPVNRSQSTDMPHHHNPHHYPTSQEYGVGYRSNPGPSPWPPSNWQNQPAQQPITTTQEQYYDYQHLQQQQQQQQQQRHHMPLLPYGETDQRLQPPTQYESGRAAASRDASRNSLIRLSQNRGMAEEEGSMGLGCGYLRKT